MKRTVIIFTILILTFFGLLAFRSAGPSVERADITGTWRLDTYRYGNEVVAFTKTAASRARIKLITGNSFLWAVYDSTTKKIIESAGGKYKLEGDTYTESIDFGYAMDSYLGTVGSFKINVADGMLYMTGYLNNGYKVEEVWRKVE